ncbi:MAG TPA: serine hydrolase [Terriglobales bacterium]|nr:serine hydrolase [Terriglobales bacterium]
MRWSVPLTLLALTAVAQQPAIHRLDDSTIPAAEIDATVTRLMKAAEVPGVAIAIINHGQIAFLKAYGFRDSEKQLPLTPDSVMTAASFTKSAFAYMVMQLVSEGQLDLDKPVYKYLPKPLPEYPAYKDLAGDDRYELISARMLLDHSSGFANWRGFEPDRKLRIHFEPGTRFAYSGEGMVLLQMVVETITGKPLEQLMEERVFRPLGMTRTSMVWQEKFETDYANGYDEYGRSLGPQKRKTAQAAGSMQTTVRDFARLVQAVLIEQGLPKKSLNSMLRPQISIRSKHEFPSLATETTHDNDAIRLSYGLGWGLYWNSYGEAFFKEGHDDGWRNYAVGFLRPKSGIVIMTNSSNGESIFKELLETLLKDTSTPIEWEGYTPYNLLPPRPALPKHTAVHVDPTVLDKYVGKYKVSGSALILLVIRREGDHLTVQENDEPKQDLMPESETQFFSTVADDVYRFESNDRAEVTTMILHTDGQDVRIPREP